MAMPFIDHPNGVNDTESLRDDNEISPPTGEDDADPLSAENSIAPILDGSPLALLHNVRRRKILTLVCMKAPETLWRELLSDLIMHILFQRMN